MELLKKFNKAEAITFYNSDEVVKLPEFTFQPNRLRGIWVSNVANIDTPKMIDQESYQTYLKEMIKRIASYNINTMIFQVRPANDAYYQSKLNPWSRFITGVEGKDPGFDVLQFVIDEASKYQIRIHAWMNPYRVSTSTLNDLNMTKEEYLATLDDLNFAKRFPEETTVDGINKVILKPSSSKVISFVSETVQEIIVNYDIDGVHIDDYFYPYAKINPLLEESDYQEYLKVNKPLSFEDWRRQNVNKMIEAIHHVVKNSLNKKGKKVLFGISPFGIYRTHSSLNPSGWDKGSFHSPKVLQCYDELYSDIYLWMKNNWIDYVVPQVYFPFEREDVSYHDLTKWWSITSKETKTTLYIGQGLYQMGNKDFWQNPDEISNQLRFNQLFDNIAGTIFFTYRDLIPGQNDIKDEALNKLQASWVQK